MARRPEAAPPARAVPQGIAAVYLPLDALHPNPRYCDVIRRRWTKYARSAGVDPGAGALD